MMYPEGIDPEPRQPAIATEKLVLPNGLFANKYSLQKIAYDAGLPVPEIITADQLEENKVTRKEAYHRDPAEFDKNYWQYAIYCRSFFTSPIDMWAVDNLPTHNDYQSEEKQKFLNRIQKTLTSPTLQYNLKNNFDLLTIPEAQSFLQRSVPEGYYISTLTRGNELFCTFVMPGGHRMVNWLHFSEGRPVNFSAGVPSLFLEYFDEELLPIVERADHAFDQALKGTFDYKHDFLQSSRGTYLIQSRIASPKTDEGIIYKEGKQIATMKENGIAEVQAEIGQINTSENILPKDVPYILTITNNWHHGRADLDKIDFKNMKGLCLPQGLRGGLLQHNGYNIIAYALYWGIPIAFI
jgi:hypothetical protein